MLGVLVLAATATLVLPSFEVSIEPGNTNFDTRFTIENTTDDVQKARINVWTDRAHPVLYYTMKIEPRSSQSISMRDLLVGGVADICASPGMRVPTVLLEAARCQLTTGCKYEYFAPERDCRLRVGNRHAHAIGFVTVDAVRDCMDLTSPDLPAYAAQIVPQPAFTGTFEQIANGHVVLTAPMLDRNGGSLPKFRRPHWPRDPKAKPPSCPPFTAPPPEL